jgi:hypothetical protein
MSALLSFLALLHLAPVASIELVGCDGRALDAAFHQLAAERSEEFFVPEILNRQPFALHRSHVALYLVMT